MIPLFLNVIYQFRHEKLQYDLTPVGFSAGCLLVLLITFKWNAFDVKTDVYGEMVKNMRDGILVFDSEKNWFLITKAQNLFCYASQEIRYRNPMPAVWIF